MYYRYIMPLFENNEIDEALQYLVDRAKRGRIDILPQGSTVSDMNTDQNFDINNLTDLPDYVFDGLMSHMYSSLFGVNLPLMANIFKVQDSFFDDFSTNILKYLNMSEKVQDAKLYYYTPLELVIKKAIHNVMKDEKFKLGHWDSRVEWNWTMLKDVANNEHYDFNNAIHPFSYFRHTKLYIKGIITEKFISHLDMYGIDGSNHSDDSSIMIDVLPSPSYGAMISIIQGIHKYF